MTGERTASAQLEIAAHWLQEAARHFNALKEYDYAQNCGRVSRQCLDVAKREGGK